MIGYVLIGICMAFDKERPPLDWKSAQWLPVYLIGMGIISWQGQFSGGAVAAPVNTGHIPFWWDMLVVAVFSLVIYYWAMATRLPRDEMLDLVNRQAAPVGYRERPLITGGRPQSPGRSWPVPGQRAGPMRCLAPAHGQ